jgi:hypothetical protein
MKTKELWLELCERAAAVERDPEKWNALVNEINRLLERSPPKGQLDHKMTNDQNKAIGDVLRTVVSALRVDVSREQIIQAISERRTGDYKTETQKARTIGIAGVLFLIGTVAAAYAPLDRQEPGATRVGT